MAEPTSTPDRHIGEDAEGRCSYCGVRIEPRDLVLAGCLLLVVSAAVTVAMAAFVIWWLVS